MDPRLYGYYEQELKFIREMGGEFAEAYPRMAARLGIDGAVACTDPYVERLLEGFAFLAARVQLKLDARHPDFTQHLLEMAYPDFLAPIPSCAIVEFRQDPKEPCPPTGLRLARGTALRTAIGKGERTACEFRSGHEVTLWPLQVTEARYISGAGALATLGLALDPRVRAAIRLRFRTQGNVPIAQLPIDRLAFYINAGSGLSGKVYEQLLANGLGVAIRATDQPGASTTLPAGAIRDLGFSDSDALLPVTKRSFSGYRLLQEYFALPERFMFFALEGLRPALQSCKGEAVEMFLLLDRPNNALEGQLDAGHFRLGCTPVVNLFTRDLDRVHVDSRSTELHLLPDRNRPQDFEIHTLESVEGIGSAGDASVPVRPFYSVGHETGADSLFYTLQRRPRLLPARQRMSGGRSNYAGSECYLSLTGPAEVRSRIAQLDARALCTNRDLPQIQIGPGTGRSDFQVEGNVAIDSVKCLTSLTFPRQSPAFGDTAWKLVSHLSLNYLSLLDSDPSTGARLLRDLLGLYVDPGNAAMKAQVDGVRTIRHEPVVRRLPIPGPISHGRGLRITLGMDESAFEGVGVLPLAALLERFFAGYVSINSFTQTLVTSVTRGEIKEWPARLGSRQLL
jgi:type VI secretion system protein ImpG